MGQRDEFLAAVAGAPSYHVFDASALQAGLGDQLSGTHLDEALRLSTRSARESVAPRDGATDEAGTRIVDIGRLIGVVAAEVVELAELTEEDFARAASGKSKRENSRDGKRSLWQRFSRSDG